MHSFLWLNSAMQLFYYFLSHSIEMLIINCREDMILYIGWFAFPWFQCLFSKSIHSSHTHLYLDLVLQSASLSVLPATSSCLFSLRNLFQVMLLIMTLNVEPLIVCDSILSQNGLSSSSLVISYTLPSILSFPPSPWYSACNSCTLIPHPSLMAYVCSWITMPKLFVHSF
jgi:hypothetical protein